MDLVDAEITNRVIIIGNGFDLHLGLETGFNHFLSSDLFQNISKTNSLAHYFRKEISKNEFWSDLEGCLSNWESWLSEKESVPEWREFKKSGRINRRTDFEEVRVAIHAFLSDKQPSRIKRELEVSHLIECWTHQSNCRIYNFNYTDTFQSHLELTKSKETVGIVHAYMHGDLEKNDIIFGTYDYPASTDFRFIMKSNSADYNPPPFSRIYEEADEIEIFGHSFGDSDRSYFAPFFNYLLDNPQYDPVVRIYTKDKASNESIRGQISSFTNNRMGEFSAKGKKLRFIHMAEMNRSDFYDRLIQEFPVSSKFFI